MSMLRGVGRPAAAILALVLCLSLAASTASGALPGRPNASAILDTRGTAISQKVQTPSSSPRSCTRALQKVLTEGMGPQTWTSSHALPQLHLSQIMRVSGQVCGTVQPVGELCTHRIVPWCAYPAHCPFTTLNLNCAVSVQAQHCLMCCTRGHVQQPMNMNPHPLLAS